MELPRSLTHTELHPTGIFKEENHHLPHEKRGSGVWLLGIAHGFSLASSHSLHTGNRQLSVGLPTLISECTFILLNKC